MGGAPISIDVLRWTAAASEEHLMVMGEQVRSLVGRCEQYCGLTALINRYKSVTRVCELICLTPIEASAV